MSTETNPVAVGPVSFCGAWPPEPCDFYDCGGGIDTCGVHELTAEVERLRAVAGRDDGLCLVDCTRHHIVAVPRAEDGEAESPCPSCERDVARAALAESQAEVERLRAEVEEWETLTGDLRDERNTAQRTLAERDATIAAVRELHVSTVCENGPGCCSYCLACSGDNDAVPYPCATIRALG